MFPHVPTACARDWARLGRRCAVLLWVTATWASLPEFCHAQSTFDWTNLTSSGAFYDVGSNWTSGGPPSSIDVARFNQNANYQVVWDAFTQSATPSVGTIEVVDGQVTLLNQEFFPIGFTVNQDLNVTGGATQLTNFGLDLSVVGNTTLSGGASLIISGAHPAGASLQSGSLSISSSTLALVNGATGDLGALSINGTMNVDSGSSLVSNSAIFGQSSFGQVRISGMGSTWDNAGTLFIGFASGGQINVESGAVVTSAGGRLGLLSTGEVRVFGSGSQWNMSGDLTVGENGSAVLDIRDGGVVANVNGIVGEGGVALPRR